MGLKMNLKRFLGKSNIIKLTTSISNNGTYPDFCVKASLETIVFDNFRRNNYYIKILEHVSKELGQAYVDETFKIDKNFLVNIESFKKNDNYGNPDLYEFEKIGFISTTTLRYIKVLYDLKKYFGELDNLKICEIGVGYGGQCRINNSTNSPASYTLVDIKQALMLCQRYLDNYSLKSQLSYKTMNELAIDSYDLVISNYAFTELTREIQDVYLKKVILNSKRGYITYNEISPDSFKSYKRDELLRIIPDSRIIEEIPLTHPKNCIIIWGDK